jgi:hypothetical protein
MSDYRYVTTQLYQSGSTPNPIIGEYQFTRVNFTQQLSSIGTFTGEILLSGLDPNTTNIEAGTTPGKVALYVFKGSTPVWGGIIWNREWDEENQLLKITAQEMVSYYQHRILNNMTGSAYYSTNADGSGTGVAGIVYNGVDPLAIIKDLLTACNAKSHGNIGVTWASSNPSSVSGGATVTRTFFDFELKTAYQAWKDLAQGASYLDFVIKPVMSSGNITNQLIVGTPTLGTTYDPTSTSSLNFQFPGNVVSYTYTEDSSRVGNYLYGIGYGANQARIIDKHYDSSKITGSGTWPLLEDSVNYVDIVTPALLTTITTGKLAAVSYPPTTVQIVTNTYTDPIYGTYNIGDGVNLIIADDRFNGGVAGTYRIIGIDVQPGETSADRVTLTLNLPLATTLVAG